MPLEGRDIVCFANDWSGDPLSKKHIMRGLARRNRILWVESLGNRTPRVDSYDAHRILARIGRFAKGLREVEANIWVLAPLAIPSYRSMIAREVNRALVGTVVRAAMHHLNFKNPITYTFVPASAWVVGTLGEVQIVYHCVDEYSAFAGAGDEIASLEESLLRKANLVIACSQPLFERKRPFNTNTHLIKHGVDHRHFARALDASMRVPEDLAKLPGQVIGFHGLIAEWIDQDLIRAVADAFPSASVVLIGDARVSLATLERAPNIHLLGRKPYESLPSYCRGFDVAMLPFTIDKLTINSSPLKLREYLAAGLPVVATAIPEARELPHVRIGETRDEFISAIGKALDDHPGPLLQRSEAVRGGSWDHQLAEIESQIVSGAATPSILRAMH